MSERESISNSKKGGKLEALRCKFNIVCALCVYLNQCRFPSFDVKCLEIFGFCSTLFSFPRNHFKIPTKQKNVKFSFLNFFLPSVLRTIY